MTNAPLSGRAYTKSSSWRVVQMRIVTNSFVSVSTYFVASSAYSSMTVLFFVLLALFRFHHIHHILVANVTASGVGLVLVSLSGMSRNRWSRILATGI